MEMHGIDIGRGNLSANPRHHDNYGIDFTSSNSRTRIGGSPSEPNWGLWGILFCSAWIGAAAQSWAVAGGILGGFFVVILLLHFSLEGETHERVFGHLEKLILFTSLSGVVFIATFLFCTSGFIASVGVITGLYGLYRFVQTRFAKALGDWIGKIIFYSFWGAFIGIALIGLGFALVEWATGT